MQNAAQRGGSHWLTREGGGERGPITADTAGPGGVKRGALHESGHKG